jgi:small GTP-binding protein
MKEAPRILNFLICGHSQHGKSSLIEAIVGQFPDNLNFELNHGTTVSLKVIQFFLSQKNIIINFLDSPGHSDFQGGIALGLEFADILGLVISGSEGFQARTYWLVDKAIENHIPVIIIITKIDLSGVNITKIKNELKNIENLKVLSIIETSSKLKIGIDELIEKITLQVKNRVKVEEDLSFIILGFEIKKGLGELVNIGIITGKLEENQWINEKFKVKFIYSLSGEPKKVALEGEIVQLLFNVVPNFELGSKYKNGKFISPKLVGVLSEIKPRKEHCIAIQDYGKFNIALEVLEKIKKIFPNLDYYYQGREITIQTQGDLQFEYLQEMLENMIDFEVIGSKIKGIITINKSSRAKYETASIKIIPRIRNKLTIHRNGVQATNQYDILGAAAPYDAFHLDGLHVEIYSGRNEEHIAQAITKAIEKVKIIKLIPYQDVIVQVENFYDLNPLIEKYKVDVLFKPANNKTFLQIKNEEFEKFFNSLMKVSEGQAHLSLLKFDFEEKILSIDPGTRHFGFCVIERGQLPSLWYVNLKRSIEDRKSHNIARKQLEYELNTFLENEKDLITKIYIGTGPGSQFIIEFLLDYFAIDSNELNPETPSEGSRIKKPDIFLIDEFKTTKEALFHLQKGELVNEVKAKGFVDHAIAALLIAKRGLKGQIIKIDKKPINQLYDYIIENYSGSSVFSSIHNLNKLEDLYRGIYLRIKDASKLDSNLNNGDIIAFTGFGRGYAELHGVTLTGNKVIVKFQAQVKLKRDFFKIFAPSKEKR